MTSITSQINRPVEWTKQHNKEVKQSVLIPNTNEYNKVLAYLSGESRIHLTSIRRIQNPYLYGRYLLRKAEYQMKSTSFIEKRLLHATSIANVDSILKDNLDWRKVKRCKFGKGVSFSPDAVYANKECSRKNGNDRAMLICKVLINSTSKGFRFTKIPKKKCDTTTDKNLNVFVKYNDDEFYPEYVAYYKNTLKPTETKKLVKKPVTTIVNYGDDSDSDDDSDLDDYSSDDSEDSHHDPYQRFNDFYEYFD